MDDNFAKEGRRKGDTAYFFRFLLSANLIMYMEAGAVPAMLIPISRSFAMSTTEQGVLGGIVFLSIAFGGTFAGMHSSLASFYYYCFEQNDYCVQATFCAITTID